MSTVFTSSVNFRTVPGNRYMSQVTLTGPTSYTTGGIPYTPSTFGFDYNVDAVILSSGGGVKGEWDRVNKKIKLLYPTGGSSAPASVGAPTATATPASGATAVTSTAAQPAIPVALVGGKGIEVASATDVSSIVIECIAFGY